MDSWAKVGIFVAVVLQAAQLAVGIAQWLGWRPDIMRFIMRLKMQTVLSVVSLLALAVTWYVLYAVRSAAPPKPASVTLQEIVGQEFKNTKVVLDGYIYTDCTFENVTFRWDGGPSAVRGTRTKIIGTRRFESFNPSAVNTVDILDALGFLEPGFAADWKHLPPEVSPSSAKP
jgi:hypothetical protein